MINVFIRCPLFPSLPALDFCKGTKRNFLKNFYFYVLVSKATDRITKILRLYCNYLSSEQ